MEQATVTTNRRLERGNGPLAGVAAGMADYFGIDPTIVRLGLVATTVLGGPTVPIVYLAAWLIIPAAEETPTAPVEPVGPWTSAATPPPAPPVPFDPVPAPPAPVTETDTVNDTVTDTMIADGGVADDETETETETEAKAGDEAEASDEDEVSDEDGER